VRVCFLQIPVYNKTFVDFFVFLLDDDTEVGDLPSFLRVYSNVVIVKAAAASPGVRRCSDSIARS
jgi:hypothetical protein